jgi:hypothetical protein
MEAYLSHTTNPKEARQPTSAAFTPLRYRSLRHLEMPRAKPRRLLKRRKRRAPIAVGNLKTRNLGWSFRSIPGSVLVSEPVYLYS